MSDEQFFENKPSQNILAQIVHRYLPFWPIFVLCTSIALAVSYIYLRAQTKIFVASAKVLLKDPQKGSGDSKVLDALNIFSEKKIVENEIIVLRSSSLMEDVVDSLDLYATIFNEGNVQTEELYADNSPIKFIALDKNNIINSGKYFFDIEWSKSVVKIAGQSIPFGGIFTVGNTQYRLDINPDYNRNVKGKNYFVIFSTISSAATRIISTLKAAPLSYSSTVIDVKMETPVPVKGINILNKLFEVYNKAAIDDKNQIAKKTLLFIQDRLDAVIGQLDSVERNIQEYKSNNSAADLGTQAATYLQNVREYDKQKATLELKLDVLSDIQNYVNSKGRKPGTVPSLTVIDDPTLSSLLGQLYSAEFELDKIKAKAGEKSDLVILGEDKIGPIKNDIRENINNIRSNFLTEKNIINSNIELNNTLYNQIPKKERGLLEYQPSTGDQK